MKNRDTVASTTLRSVLSEINSAEKSSKDGNLSSSAMTVIIRKAVQRRVEAAFAFHDGKRPDLAAKEEKEVELLSKFLPPLLSVEDIDMHLKVAMRRLPAGSDPKRSLGLALKEFYSKTDKSTVEAHLVKERAQVLLQSNAS
ncbi:hypothetical protein NLJ89_g60 [Agrocybe chaxingu]|uniref:Altered inheritance of mitochondria protein 41 n=1 Tax=Agrocybe chaxingu TaxID=84603 RepID=A0A9W8TFH0_9AGAR|nr:hypothetical protein NLJ89_g60 [Agrocybe chaxingu]